MVKNTTNDKMRQNLPSWSFVDTNLCNIKAETFGNLEFQFDPTPIYIKGVQNTYRSLFDKLDKVKDHGNRCSIFLDYMEQHFGIPILTSFTRNSKSLKNKVGYLKLLRGWFFDTDGREGALIKGWVESRFGLSPLYHKGKLFDKSDTLYKDYLEMRRDGSRLTLNHECQLDLLYSFGQYQLRREKILKEIIPLYRGINKLDDFPHAERIDKRSAIVLLNNMNSFSSDRDVASQFGDMIVEIAVPKEKIFAYPGLLPQRLQSEHEFMVLGGLYKAQLSFM